MHEECPTCGGSGEVRIDQDREAMEKDLFNPSLYERDDAVLGLLSLDDPRSIPAVEMAIAVERSPDIKGDMRQLLDQLKNNRAINADTRGD